MDAHRSATKKVMLLNHSFVSELCSLQLFRMRKNNLLPNGMIYKKMKSSTND